MRARSEYGKIIICFVKKKRGIGFAGTPFLFMLSQPPAGVLIPRQLALQLHHGVRKKLDIAAVEIMIKRFHHQMKMRSPSGAHPLQQRYPLLCPYGQLYHNITVYFLLSHGILLCNMFQVKNISRICLTLS